MPGLGRLARRLGYPVAGAWLSAHGEDVGAALRAAALAGVVDFASGASRPADVLGLFDAGVPVGVAADACGEDCERELLAGAELSIPVFVDSGAFSEFTRGRAIDPGEWERRLGLYRRVVALYGPLATVVAPDQVASQAGTLARLEAHAGALRELLDMGARVVVPVQVGALPAVAFCAEVDRVLGRTDWTVGVPANKAPMPLSELRELVRARRPTSVHLLGIGAKRSTAAELVDAVRAIVPGASVSMDSNKLRARAGEGRPLTRAEREAADRLAGGMWGDNDAYASDEGGAVGDYTEMIGSPGDWMRPADTDELCRTLDLTPDELARCRADLSAFLQEEPDPEGDPGWTRFAQVEHEIDALWQAHVERSTRRSRRREAVRTTFGGGEEERARPLRGRVHLVPALPGDINAYVTERHYLHRGRTLAQLGYWIVLDDASAEALALTSATRAPAPARWTLGGVPIAGAIQYALPRVSAPRLYGYHPMELLELARLYLEPVGEGDRGPRMLATAAIGRSLRRVPWDWRQAYPNLPAPKAIVSWADATRHEGAIYKGAGFVAVGRTEGDTRRTRQDDARARAHADYGNEKIAFVLPLVPPDPRTSYHARYVLYGVCREGAHEVAMAVRDHAARLGLDVPGASAREEARAGTQRAYERGYDYLPEWPALELVIPLLGELRGRRPQDVAAELADVFARAASDVEYCADAPRWEWEIEQVRGANYTRSPSGTWRVHPVERTTRAMGGDDVRALLWNPRPACAPPPVPGGRRASQLARALGFDDLAGLLEREAARWWAWSAGVPEEDLDDPTRAPPGRLLLLNMGLGRDSVTMLLLLADGRLVAEGAPVRVRDVDAVVFADTGAEWDHTVLLAARVRAECARLGVRFLHLQKPAREEWEPWVGEQVAGRRAAGAGWSEIAERELPRLEDARERELARVRAERDAALRSRSRDAGEVRAAALAEIARIKKVHRDEVRRLAAPFRYVAETPPWAYRAEGVEARAADGSYHTRPPILEDFASKDTIACRDDKSCTANHKVLPIRRATSDLSVERFGPWASNRGWSTAVGRGQRAPHLNLIGLAADETSRIERAEGGGAFEARYVTEAYPLAELGIAKADETPILEAHGFGDVRKSGCWMCPHQPVSWWWALSQLAPERFEAAVRYEARAASRTRPVLRIVGAIPLDEAVRAWRAEHPDATLDEVLAKTYAKACNRPAPPPAEAPLAANPRCPRCALRAAALEEAGVAPVLPLLGNWRPVVRA